MKFTYEIFRLKNDKLKQINKTDYTCLDRARECAESDCRWIANTTRTDTMLQYIIFSVQEDGSKIAVELHTATAQPRTNRCEK